MEEASVVNEMLTMETVEIALSLAKASAAKAIKYKFMLEILNELAGESQEDGTISHGEFITVAAESQNHNISITKS